MSNKKDEALKLALECVEAWDRGCERDPYWRDIEAAIAAIKEALEEPAQQPSPPAWWPAVENILKEYGLQAIDFVADFKQALAEQPAQQQKPVARVINKSIVWRPCDIAGLPVGTPLYTSPQQHIEHCIWARNGNQPCPHVQPAQQEPVVDIGGGMKIDASAPLVLTPHPAFQQPAQPSKPLTDERRKEIINKSWNDYLRGKDDGTLFSWYLSFDIEAAHGIKENGND